MAFAGTERSWIKVDDVCSLASTKACTTNADCPAGEGTCVPGVTEIRLQFTGERDGDNAADQVVWTAGEAGAVAAPRLAVTYTAP